MIPAGRIYLGVDQTGAVVRRVTGSVYRPLPAAIAIPLENQTIEIRAATRSGKPIHLDKFDPECVASVFLSNGITATETIALVDCVLGLPSSMRRTGDSLRRLLTRASAFDANTAIPAGRKRAAAFFQGILDKSGCGLTAKGGWPLRHCEKITSSNSVFQEHPFQKNIQSGTYRIWCDLGRSVEKKQDMDLRFWPHDFSRQGSGMRPKGTPSMIIAEGYPSLYWRKIFGLASRQPAELRDAAKHAMKLLGWSVRCRDWEVIESDPDLADAVVLALAALVMDVSHDLFQDFNISTAATRQDHFTPEFEGWIAGAQADFFTDS